ncbi:MAG: hydroxyisourate hydrolase [Deinococcales bacterium]
MARLSTHVLDLVSGKPAANLVIELYQGQKLIQRTQTNSDGRTDEPLLSGDSIPTGHFKIIFQAGDYLKAQGYPLSDPPFLDRIPIDFAIADAKGHYHVPLLLSPHGYSTYRGS